MSRNRDGHLSFLPHICGMCFSAGYSSNVAPQRCILRLPAEVIQYVLFRFRVQRYNNYLTYANFFAKKMQNML